ncbi:MAG: proton-conducting transporter transmembrane domain-containing protein [Actinomycetes bacterium]
MTADLAPALVVVALVLFGLAGAVDLVPGAARQAAGGVAGLLALGSLALVVVGGLGLAGTGAVVDLGGVFGIGGAGLRVDPLSALFLVLAFGVAVPVTLAMVSWARAGASRTPGLGETTRPHGRGQAAGVAMALGAVALMVMARDAFTFLFGWEALTFSFYLLAGQDRRRVAAARSSLVTVVFGKVSGGAVLLGLLMLAASAHTWALAGFSSVPAGGIRDTAYALLLLGFAVKVGVAPVEVWLPAGYGNAPGPVRAVMAGVAVNAGFYGIWRTLDLLGRPPAWIPVLMLVVAGLSALLGIAHVTVASRLTRLVAYSSVENAGLILVGVAVALVGEREGIHRLVAVGLLAGMLQVTTHAVAKSLLFVTTASLESAVGSDELDQMRGMGRRLPWSGAGFTIGAVTLAGLPPTVGFASEWFLLEALMQQFRVSGLVFRLAMAVAGALVALTAGFAGVAFVRVIGLTVLGPTRTPPAPHQRSVPGERGVLSRTAIVLLGLGCLGVAAVSPLEVRVIARGLSSLVAEPVTRGATASPWVLQPVFSGFSILSPSWLWIALGVMVLLVAGVGLAAGRRRVLAVRRVPSWHSAAAPQAGLVGYSPFAYANPTRRILANVLHTRTGRQGPTVPVSGTPLPWQATVRDAEPVGYRSDVVEVVETFVYRPLVGPGRLLVRAAKAVQSGRLDAYVAYMLITLVAVLAVVTALA